MSGDLARPEPLDLLRQLETEGKATLVSLDLADKVSWDTFAALCTYLGNLRNATAFWIGDALNFGDTVFGFDASQAEAFLGRSPETLRRWQWTCEKVAKSRRRVGLSFTHHENVASLSPAEQGRWLDHSEQHGLSANELRAAIRSAPNEVRPARGAESTDPAPTSPGSDLEPGPSGPEAGEPEEGVCPTCGRPLQLAEGASRRPPWA